MKKRFAAFAATCTAALTLLVVLPMASSAAEPSPWWQVLTGSRPVNLWEPADASEIQQVDTAAFFGVIFAAKVEVGGEVVGCLARGSLQEFGGPSADEICEAQTGFPGSETSAEFEEMLEEPYGAGKVEVTGGPAGVAPFQVKSPWGPPIELTVLKLEIFGQTLPMAERAQTKVVSKGSGRLFLNLTNLGTEAVDGATSEVRIVDELPDGVVPYDVEGFGGYDDTSGPVRCFFESATRVACEFDRQLPPYEAIEVEIPVVLAGQPPAAAAPGEVTVSGGGAAAVTVEQDVKVSPEPTPFGIERFTAEAEEEGGGTTGQAGLHPFQFTTTIQLNSGRIDLNFIRKFSSVEQPALPRNLDFPLPPGLVGNAAAMPECDMKTFLTGFELQNLCPDASAVGATALTVVEPANVGFSRFAVPVFNLSPAIGEPARFGFVAAGVPVVINTSVDPNDDYRITASVKNVGQLASFLSSTLTLWGAPGDPLHDNARGWNCVFVIKADTCQRPSDLSEAAFMRMPVSCVGPLEYGVSVEPWNVPRGSAVSRAAAWSDQLHGCNRVPFDPSIEAAPTSRLAESPTGLSFQLKMPNSGLLNKDGIAEGQPKKVEVSLPEGMTINASQAEGLAVCSPADYARERFDSKPGEGCPEASKIGEVRVATPLLKEEPRGALYIAKPRDNPFGSLIALYMVARVPERGILIKQAGRVEPDPKTGQLVTTFDDLPQLPFSDFTLRFREGGRAPLVTPSGCGRFETVARFTPWSAVDPNNPQPSEIVTRTSSFTIERGVDGAACPSGGAPFHPGFEAGSLNPSAGKYSPFYMRLTRQDGDQDLTKFSAILPKGALAKLAGVNQCPQAAIESAKGRDGVDEKASPSCPASSRIGRTTVGAGVGSILTYVPGQLYLGGPYKGAPLSVVSITPAVAGPFDVGTVVVQEALRLNPRTGEVRVDGSSSDPIPHILAGIPLKIRDLRVYVDRPEFTTTPTSCDPMATAADLFSSGADVFSAVDDVPVSLSARYQAANCERLGFKPRLKIHLSAKRSTRGANPRLRAVLRPRAGNANAERIAVTLPGSELLEQAHIRTICTRAQYAANGGMGVSCPKGSVYGHVKAWTPLLDEPLQGPVFLRSSSNELPDMVLALRGLVDVEAVGRIDSVNARIRTTFEELPDAPLTKVVLTMQGGRKSLLANSTDICRGVHRAIGNLVGQNGKLHTVAPKVTANCKRKRR